MLNDMEIWKDVEGYEGLYQISSEGRVKSLGNGKSNASKKRLIKTFFTEDNYKRCYLTKNGKTKPFLVHRLVGLTFIPNPENKPFIDHINCNRSDNRVDNLRWVTNKENCNNPITLNNYSKCRIGKSHPNSKHILQFSKQGEFIRRWECVADFEKEHNLRCPHIHSCCKGKRNTAYGYIWMYAVINGFEIDINKLKRVV